MFADGKFPLISIATWLSLISSPITSITPLMPGKIIVKMGLFDEIPKAQLEIYTKNKQAWEPDYGIPTFVGAPGG